MKFCQDGVDKTTPRPIPPLYAVERGEKQVTTVLEVPSPWHGEEIEGVRSTKRLRPKMQGEAQMDDLEIQQPDDLDGEDEEDYFKGPFDYPPPVDKLLTYGDPRGSSRWPNYRELGLRREHIPHLMNMVQDDTLHDAPSEENGKPSPKVWAPLHAWRALGQLRAEEAVDVLIEQFWRVEDGDDWVLDEMPVVLAMIGPMAIPALADYLAPEQYHGIEPRIVAIDCLEAISEEWNFAHWMVVEVLKRELQKYRQHYPPINVALIRSLLALDAREALPLIVDAAASEFVTPEFAPEWRTLRRDAVKQIWQNDNLMDEEKQAMIDRLYTSAEREASRRNPLGIGKKAKKKKRRSQR